MNYSKRIFSLLMVICLLIGIMVVPANAATVDESIIDMTEACSLTIYKVDFTNAAKDGVWNTNSYVSTGHYDPNVNAVLGVARTGAASTSNALGDANNGSSNGYMIKGVEYTYVKVATPYQFTESDKDAHPAYSHVELLWQFDKTLAADLLKAIGLTGGANSYENANALDANSWFYQSDVINKALADTLASNPTTLKNALEDYAAAHGTAMTKTDENGRSVASNLSVGLYLLVETAVPEMVTSTTNPFFVALPMTDIDGGSATVGFENYTQGGTNWNYNPVIYPKNETGIVSLEKTVREKKDDTGKNNASSVITDGWAHNASASAGDTVEFQIISTIPTITSEATNISTYKFTDVLSRGLTYNDDVILEWFTDANCTDKVATWKPADSKFTVNTTENADGSHTRVIDISAKGLAEINAINTSAENQNDRGNAADGKHLYSGYSNYTVRVTYSAEVNSNESMVYGDDANCNEVVLTWARTSSEYLDTLIDDCHVYSYGLDLTKTFSDGKTDAEMFKEVRFVLRNKTDGYFVQAQLNETEGIWYVTGHTTDEAAAARMYPVNNWEDSTGSVQNGRLIVKGLEPDEYILNEVATYTGYNLLKEDTIINLTIADDASRPCDIYSDDILGLIQNDARFNFTGPTVNGGMSLALANIPQKALAHNLYTASATIDGNDVTMENDEMDKSSTNALIPMTVVNNHGFQLPQTGETSATYMPIIGGTMIAMGMFFIFFFIAKRKKEEEEAA